MNLTQFMKSSTQQTNAVRTAEQAQAQAAGSVELSQQMALPMKGRAHSTVSGTNVPTFEKSVVHAAARDALIKINQVNAFDDVLAEEWLASSGGSKLRNLLREYIQHGHLKGIEG